MTNQLPRTPFLQDVAESILDRHGNALHELCLVFPGRRAGLFFNHYLSGMVKEPVWSPAFLSINELVQEFTGRQLADPLYLLFCLHGVYKEIKPTGEDFDEFYHWGEAMLSDFNDVDKYLVDARGLFANLADLRELGDDLSYLTPAQWEIIRQFWGSIQPGKLSAHQENFIDTWKILFPLFEAFKTRLSREGLAYEGMMYRELADSIRAGQEITVPYKKLVFVGFNALNTCEKVLLDYFRDRDMAEFYWDYDAYYTFDNKHEAGLFMRENLSRYPGILDYRKVNRFETREEPIRFIAAPSASAQAGILSSLLRQESPNVSPGPLTTAVVLPDEHLLMPVLFSIPEYVDPVNVTMGLPITATPVFSLVENLMALQQAMRQSGGTPGFWHKPVQAILHHQYIMGSFPTETGSLSKEIIALNKVFVEQDFLSRNEFLVGLFHVPDAGVDWLKYLSGITREVYHETNLRGILSPVEKESLFALYTGLNRLMDILEKLDMNLKKETYNKLIRQVIRGIRVSFVGEPLAGLQVMGFLETRALDFDHVILLSMNEANIPRASHSLSFIPYNLRVGHGLPTTDFHDAMYAYYFYRLIQRARRVDLVYNAQANHSSSGEMSRFIYQLKYDQKIKTQESSVHYILGTGENIPLQIHKTQGVLEGLARKFSGENDWSGLSPSAINQYLDCGIKFYFAHVARLAEIDEVSEEVDAAMFGTLLHEVMCNLYSPYLKKPVTREIIDELARDNQTMEQHLLDAFSRHYFQRDTPITLDWLEGKNILVHEVLLRYIKQILEVDKQYTPFVPLQLEQKVTMPWQVNLNGQSIPIRLKGIIDRVDRVEEGIRIIDYKSGTVRLDFKSLESLINKDPKQSNKAVWQVLLYARVWMENNPGQVPVIPGIYSIKKVFSKDFDYKLIQKPAKDKNPVNDAADLLDEIDQALGRVIDEIFDPGIPFSQTSDLKTCQFCEFKEICHR